MIIELEARPQKNLQNARQLNKSIFKKVYAKDIRKTYRFYITNNSFIKKNLESMTE